MTPTQTQRIRKASEEVLAVKEELDGEYARSVSTPHEDGAHALKIASQSSDLDRAVYWLSEATKE